MNPTEDMIDITDIAHSLSMLCRFTGHTKFFYSVGQHSWLGSYVIPHDYSLEFLLHDATEAYIGDMSRPLKHMTAAGHAYKEVEQNIARVIRSKFGLPAIQSDLVHMVDNKMLYAEKEQLMPPKPWPNDIAESCECQDRTAAKILIYESYPKEIETVFVRRFDELKQRNKLTGAICQ